MNYVQTPVLKITILFACSSWISANINCSTFFGSRLLYPKQEVQNGMWEFTLQNERWMWENTWQIWPVTLIVQNSGFSYETEHVEIGWL